MGMGRFASVSGALTPAVSSSEVPQAASGSLLNCKNSAPRNVRSDCFAVDGETGARPRFRCGKCDVCLDRRRSDWSAALELRQKFSAGVRHVTFTVSDSTVRAVRRAWLCDPVRFCAEFRPPSSRPVSIGWFPRSRYSPEFGCSVGAVPVRHTAPYMLRDGSLVSCPCCSGGLDIGCQLEPYGFYAEDMPGKPARASGVVASVAEFSPVELEKAVINRFVDAGWDRLSHEITACVRAVHSRFTCVYGRGELLWREYVAEGSIGGGAANGNKRLHVHCTIGVHEDAERFLTNARIKACWSRFRRGSDRARVAAVKAASALDRVPPKQGRRGISMRDVWRYRICGSHLDIRGKKGPRIRSYDGQERRQARYLAKYIFKDFGDGRLRRPRRTPGFLSRVAREYCTFERLHPLFKAAFVDAEARQAAWASQGRVGVAVPWPRVEIDGCPVPYPLWGRGWKNARGLRPALEEVSEDVFTGDPPCWCEWLPSVQP